MRLLIDNKLIPSLSFILGVAICVSTSVISISYTLIAVLVLFKKDLLVLIQQTIKNKYILGSLILYLALIIGTFWSVASSAEIVKMLIKEIGFLLAPLFLIAFQTNNSGKLFLKGFVIGAVFTAMLSLISCMTNHHILYGIRDHTWVVFHGHILHNAFLAIAASFLLMFIFEKKLTKLTRFYALLAYLICFIDVMFVVTGRTGQIMLLVMSAFLVVYRFKSRGLIFLVVVAVALTPFLLKSPAVQKGIADYKYDMQRYEQGNTVTSMGLRREFRQNSLELIKAKPIFGYGTASFTKVYKDHTGYNGPRAATNPHSDLLTFGVELGILGVIAFISFIVLVIMNLLQLRWFYKGMGLTIMLGYLLASLQNSFFVDNVTGLAFIFLIISLIAASNTHRHCEQSSAIPS